MNAERPGGWLSPEAAAPDVFNRPELRMVPFDASRLDANAALATRPEGLQAGELGPLFGPAPHALFTQSGREAIGIALDEIGVSGEDEVCILTTTGSPYVSACVTEAIHKRGRSARTLSEKTRAVLLIHEFGFPAALPAEARGLPLIEDCAYAFGSRGDDGQVGGLGDYVVFSLPKAMPVAFGGVLKARRPIGGASLLSVQGLRELEAWTHHYLPHGPDAFSRRREIYGLYESGLAAHGFRPLFRLEPGVVPHSFVVALPDQAVAERMKPRMQEAGVISSVFYGGGGYFLPNHQAMGPASVEYVISAFLTAHRQASVGG